MENRQYKATFILNLRESKRQVPAIIEWLKTEITTLGGKVEGSEDIGVKDFVRVTQKNNPNGHFVAITFSASGDLNAGLQARLALETEIKRVFVEKALAVATK